jgi:hypothetical protein
MASTSLRFPDFFRHLTRCLPDRFVREPRKITPAQLMGVLCMMTGFGRIGYRRVVAELQTGLGRAFGWIHEADIPSPQAIGQARKSLSPVVCDDAFAAVFAGCIHLSSSPVAAYGGYRLLGVDGTRLSLPPSKALIGHFGCPKNQHGVASAPMAGLVQLWDVGRNCPVAFELGRADFDERGLALKLFESIGRQDLIIADRGLPGFDQFLAICRRRARFIIRCPTKADTAFGKFLASGEDDTVIFLIKRDNKRQRVPGSPRIPVRLLRITLASGTAVVLATNLWRQRGHDRATLGRLYTQRWCIETAFREMKVYHALETFSATYPDGIYQEIAAIQIFLLLTSELEAMARCKQTPGKKEKSGNKSGKNGIKTERLVTQNIRFNRLLIADNVIHLLRATAIGGKAAARKSLVGILEYLWKQRSVAKPGRTYPRQRKRPLGYYRASGA